MVSHCQPQKAHVILKLTESDGQQQNVTAQLELISENVPISVTRWPWSKKPKKYVAVVTTSPSQYKVSYTAISRGQHKLHIQVNDIDISGSPFTVTVYPDPTLLSHPVKVLTDANRPYGISFNKSGEIVVSECQGHRVSIFDIKGQKIRTFGSHGNSPDQMKFPQGVAIDEMDNMYVSSVHKLQKFTSDGELVKCVGQRGWKAGEFDDPRGVTLYNNHVYVCDCDNHRIQVFDLDLSFIRSINSDGTVRGEFNAPFDVKFDAAGNMYLAEFTAKRVRVMDNCGHFLRAFGQQGKIKLDRPSSLHIVDKFVYVSDYSGNCVVVYETSGQFVTTFGKYGQKEGEFRSPCNITSCADGFIYVCDYYNTRLQIF